MNEDQYEDDCKNQRDSIATGSKHGRQLIATVRRRNEDKKNQNLNKRNKRVTGIMMRSRDTKALESQEKEISQE
jgi:mitochondrial fission protein ELM1